MFFNLMIMLTSLHRIILIKLCILKWRHTVSSNFLRQSYYTMEWEKYNCFCMYTHFTFQFWYDMATIYPTKLSTSKKVSVYACVSECFTCFYLTLYYMRNVCVCFQRIHSDCLKIFSRSFRTSRSGNDRVSIVRDEMFVRLLFFLKMEKATDVCYAVFLLNDYVNGLDRTGCEWEW